MSQARASSWLLLPAAGLVAGCDNRQSVLWPHGPEAAQILNLGLVLFMTAALVLALVGAALWLALRGTPAARSRLAREHTVLVAGLVFPVVTLTALLGYSVWLQAGLRAFGLADVERIEVVGEQWWWRLHYVDRNGRPFASANEIRIPVGRTVEISLRSADVIHSFWVPSLAGKLDAIPGRTTRLRLAAHAPGIYRGQCAEYCGGPHALMAFEVVALPEAQFAAWQDGEAAPAREPASEPERRGQRLFLAAGCGACHAIRGTPASGPIGPDLTHVGGRRSIAANTLPMSQANLAGFIADGQRLKPGNTMPPFRIFSDTELQAVAAYLLSLR
ncbi:MAG: c-type cytochrome [Hyphomicrobiales bacterium]|nr:c-type cytochrome [Hyphomicrobiales bacterium]